jgi:hypothetical protein
VSTCVLRCSAGDLAVLSGYLRLPQRGNFVAALECALTTAPAGACSLLFTPEARGSTPAAAPSVFAGFIRFAEAIEGSNTLTVEMVGGAGQLQTELPPLEHVLAATTIPAGLVAAAIVAALPGEALAPGVEQALDAYQLPRWHRAGGITARDAIDVLVYDLATWTGLDLGWRMLANGTIWIGLETYPVVDVATYPGTEYAGQVTTDAAVLYAPSGAPLLPGTVVTSSGKGGTISTQAVEVEYTLVPPALRAKVRQVMPGQPARVPDLSLYARSWGATVAGPQNADGTLDVTCDDARMGDMRRLSFRLGVPGATVVGIPRGARVRVRFQDGSPRGAYACDVDQDPGDTQPFALVGDGCGSLAGIAPPGGGQVTFSIVPAGTPGSIALSIVGPGAKYLRGLSGP